MATCGEHGGKRADGSPCGNKVSDVAGDLCYLHEDRIPSLPPLPEDVPEDRGELVAALWTVAKRQALGLGGEGDGRLALGILQTMGEGEPVRMVDLTPEPVTPAKG